MQRTISMRALGYTLFSLSLAHLGHVWGIAPKMHHESYKGTPSHGADLTRNTHTQPTTNTHPQPTAHPHAPSEPTQGSGRPYPRYLATRAHNNTPKPINYLSTKLNVGYLYNRGTKKLVTLGSGNHAFSENKSAPDPAPFAIVVDYSDWVGTFVSILTVNLPPKKPDLGSRSTYETHNHVNRLDVLGGIWNKKIGLWGTTMLTNRMGITPPYYKGESAFKIKLWDQCLTVASDNRLITDPCIDDNNGMPTDANNRQLFEWQHVEVDKACDS
ncbi:hypothetical protein NEDG_02090 [Nematocida displodere]|uniref:Uncharacterized protein n=1 Tax=Nematocida displodere TaxID=1805483 RepID=A0A177EL28_9MICR|nr:hypothetical protein NEDG_02090 [Nematocida displodere]